MDLVGPWGEMQVGKFVRRQDSLSLEAQGYKKRLGQKKGRRSSDGMKKKVEKNAAKESNL